MTTSLLTRLNHSSYTVRLAAAHEAHFTTEEEIVLAVVQRLYDWHPKVRLAAAFALKGTQHPAALEALYEGCRDKDREFRRACLEGVPPITKAA